MSTTKAMESALEAIASCFTEEFNEVSKRANKFARAIYMSLDNYKESLAATAWIPHLTEGRAFLQDLETLLEAEDGVSGTSAGRRVALDSNIKILKRAFRKVEEKAGVPLLELDDAAFTQAIWKHANDLAKPTPRQAPQGPQYT